MAWLRVDDKLLLNAKWTQLTQAEKGSLIELWLWTTAAGQDGHIPDHQPKVMRIPRATITRFEVIGWLHRNGSGWVINDWSDHNPPADPDERARWMKAQRQKRWRHRQADGGVDAEVDGV